jgi:hypothetical protein
MNKMNPLTPINAQPRENMSNIVRATHSGANANAALGEVERHPWQDALATKKSKSHCINSF